MAAYIIRRLMLLPVTLFFIILVNFVIINLAPGDPVTVIEVSNEGQATQQEGQDLAFGSDIRYLQFREHYGLTLPVLINLWPFLTQAEVEKNLIKLLDREKLSAKAFDDLRIKVGDQAKFVMRHLLAIAEDEAKPLDLRQIAVQFFIRGGTQQAILGSNLNRDQKNYNKKIAKDNSFLYRVKTDSQSVEQKVELLQDWYLRNKNFYQLEPAFSQKLMLTVQTRFFRYLSRVVTLDFGSMRSDDNRRVITEVTKRFKYSLTLAILPMFITFFLSQLFGLWMACRQNRSVDFFLNVLFLILYAAPVFVVAPFLIEKVGLTGHFPFTNTPIPISGFTSSDSIWIHLNSWQRFWDILRHIFLPLIAILYGGLAAQARLARTAVLEVLRQDFVRAARAKGLSESVVLFKHVARPAAITIVTSIAGSLGVVLGGSLIVETLFEIDGFGKFFYDAVINRDYNVIMFSALAGSTLTLLGYLVADIAYTVLDPRVSLE